MSRTRAEELTYYDELGVPQDASPQQIRDAFRGLAKLLHPDQHTDDNLKSLAELQMRKLNRIYSVLADPRQRGDYDRALLAEREAPSPDLIQRLSTVAATPAVSRISWIGAVALVIGAIAWLGMDGAPNPIATVAERAASQPVYAAENESARPDSSKEIAQLRSDLNLARVERDAAIHEVARLRSRSASLNPAPRSTSGEVSSSAKPGITFAAPPEIQTNTVAAVPAFVPPAGLVSQPAPGRSQPFNGFWFFVRTQDDKKNPSLYPPEFIETTINEQSGQVHGRYRSRYRITDRAISPDVNFDFTGILNPTSNTITAGWTGAGGARGEITLKLLSEHSMRVEWSTDRLGSIQGLTSGTAALTRRLD